MGREGPSTTFRGRGSSYNTGLHTVETQWTSLSVSLTQESSTMSESVWEAFICAVCCYQLRTRAFNVILTSLYGGFKALSVIPCQQLEFIATTIICSLDMKVNNKTSPFCHFLVWVGFLIWWVWQQDHAKRSFQGPGDRFPQLEWQRVTAQGSGIAAWHCLGPGLPWQHQTFVYHGLSQRDICIGGGGGCHTMTQPRQRVHTSVPPSWLLIPASLMLTVTQWWGSMFFLFCLFVVFFTM